MLSHFVVPNAILYSEQSRPTMSEGTLDVPPDYSAKNPIYKTVIHFTVFLKAFIFRARQIYIG